MSYKILPTKEFEKDFKKLALPTQERIKKKMSGVAEDPKRYKQLHYSLSGSCRIRVGKLRIIFSYNSSQKELYLEKVILGHKY